MKQKCLSDDWYTEMRKSARFSECRKWRYDLWRRWGAGGLEVAFIGLNPSTADEEKNDPTVRRCIGFAQYWGFAGMHMLNLFGLRSTDPLALYESDNPVGLDNDLVICEICEEVGQIVLCWGNHGRYLGRGKAVLDMLVKKGLWCRAVTLKVTSAGQPGHTLYLAKITKRKQLEQEAQCPECKEWSGVEWQGHIPPGGYWWNDSGSCPHCGEIVLVESECEFRPRLFR